MSLKAERTAAIQRSLETRERTPLAYFDSRKYIQHNVLLGDGLEPILAFMDLLPPDRNVRQHAFADAGVNRLVGPAVPQSLPAKQSIMQSPRAGQATDASGWDLRAR